MQAAPPPAPGFLQPSCGWQAAFWPVSSRLGSDPLAHCSALGLALPLPLALHRDDITWSHRESKTEPPPHKSCPESRPTTPKVKRGTTGCAGLALGSPNSRAATLPPSLAVPVLRDSEERCLGGSAHLEPASWSEIAFLGKRVGLQHLHRVWGVGSSGGEHHLQAVAKLAVC